MTVAEAGSPGATRQCPHCRERILASAAVCPACRHHLRYGVTADAAPQPVLTPLRIEGSIRHPPDGDAWEYNVVVTIRNHRGEEIGRKLVGIGALDRDEQCTFTLAVEVLGAKAKRRGKPTH